MEIEARFASDPAAPTFSLVLRKPWHRREAQHWVRSRSDSGSGWNGQLTGCAMPAGKATPSLEVLKMGKGEGQTAPKRQVTPNQGVTSRAGKSQVKLHYGSGRA